MRILTYKRTHTGDPNVAGQFGINDCMGRVRSWDFDAVIGVGGYGHEPRSEGIEGRVTWVGVTPTWSPHPEGHGVIVTFESFKLLDKIGPMLHVVAPLLARRMYEKKARVLLKSYSPEEKAEAQELIKSVLNLSSIAPPNAEARQLRCRVRRICKNLD
jgi:hypothetical protein